MIYYPDDFKFEQKKNPSNITVVKILESDTFTYAQENKDTKFCCLNFASSKVPGGGYKGPAKAQEEDLFRRSNLPELMDNDETKKHYPLMDRCGIYCPEVNVLKDKDLKDIEPFEVSVLTLPAVYKPSKKSTDLIIKKVQRIFEIALENEQYNLILGCWGCGAYHNDPKIISKTFAFFINEYNNVFSQLIFPIPDKNSDNYKIFEEELNENKI